MSHRQVYQAEKSSKVIALQEESADVEKDLMLRQLLWESIEEWSHLHNAWRLTSFSELDVAYLHKEMSRFVQAIYLLEKGKQLLRQWIKFFDYIMKS